MVIVPCKTLALMSEKMLAMKLVTCFLQLLAGLLPAVHAAAEQRALSAGNNSTEAEVVPFHEVWGRSYCRPREKLVDIISEYPDEVEYIFSPSCVPLLRCSGCCGDESLQCVPVQTANITMQVLKISTTGDHLPYSEMAFSQHIECECRPIEEKTTPERRRNTGRGKRKKEKQKPTN